MFAAVQVGFERAEYSAREGESVEVCVVKAGRSDSAVDVLVASAELSVNPSQRATSKLHPVTLILDRLLLVTL